MRRMSDVEVKCESVMDPTVWTLAGEYAEGLSGYLEDDSSAASAAEELEAVCDMLEGIEGCETLFTGAMMTHGERIELIDRVFAGRCSEAVEALLGVLARNDRLNLLVPLTRRFRRLLNDRQGKVEVTIVTAKPLGQTDRRRVCELTGQIFDCEPILTENVDPSVIGGLIVQVGDRLYDSSVAGRLRQVREMLLDKLDRDRPSHQQI